jgi:serine/threonine protein kinase
MNPPAKTSKHHTYTLISRIGNGNFGEVFLVQSNVDQNHYVVKVITLPFIENQAGKSIQRVQVASTQRNKTNAAAKPLLCN